MTRGSHRQKRQNLSPKHLARKEQRRNEKKDLERSDIIQPLQDEININSGNIDGGYTTSIAFANGNVALLFRSFMLNGDSSISLLVFDANNEVIKSAVLSFRHFATPLLNPRISVHNNKALITWLESQPGAFRVYGQIIDDVGKFLTPIEELFRATITDNQQKVYLSSILPDGKVVVFFHEVLLQYTKHRIFTSDLLFISEFRDNFSYKQDNNPKMLVIRDGIELFHIAGNKLFRQKYDLNGNKIARSDLVNGELQIELNTSQIINYTPIKLNEDGDIGLLWQHGSAILFQAFDGRAIASTAIINIADQYILKSAFFINDNSNLLILYTDSSGDQHGKIFDVSNYRFIGPQFRIDNDISELVNRHGKLLAIRGGGTIIQDASVNFDNLLLTQSPTPSASGQKSPNPITQSPTPSASWQESPNPITQSPAPSASSQESLTPTQLPTYIPPSISYSPSQYPALPSQSGGHGSNNSALILGVSFGAIFLVIVIIIACIRLRNTVLAQRFLNFLTQAIKRNKPYDQLDESLELTTLDDGYIKGNVDLRFTEEVQSRRVTQSLPEYLSYVITNIMKLDQIGLPITKKDQESEIQILRVKIDKLQPKHSLKKIATTGEIPDGKRLIFLYKQRLWQLGVKDQKDDDGKILAWEELPIVKIIKIRDKYLPAIIKELNSLTPNNKIINDNVNKILLRKDEKITETPNFNLKMLGAKLSPEIELLRKRSAFLSQLINEEEKKPASNPTRPRAGSTESDKSK
jgi:hypothetical protein